MPVHLHRHTACFSAPGLNAMPDATLQLWRVLLTCRPGCAQVPPQHGVVHRHHDHADRARRRVRDARRVALHCAAGERLPCLRSAGSNLCLHLTWVPLVAVPYSDKQLAADGSDTRPASNQWCALLPTHWRHALCPNSRRMRHAQVTNHPELHEYSARQTLEALKRGANHDAMVGAAAAIVGALPAPQTSLRRW